MLEQDTECLLLLKLNLHSDLPAEINEVPMYMYERVGAGLKEPVVLMTDDVLAERGWCIIIFKVLVEPKHSMQHLLEASCTFRAISIVAHHLKNCSISL